MNKLIIFLLGLTIGLMLGELGNPYDLNNDGKIDIQDASILMSRIEE